MNNNTRISHQIRTKLRDCSIAAWAALSSTDSKNVYTSPRLQNLLVCLVEDYKKTRRPDIPVTRQPPFELERHFWIPANYSNSSWVSILNLCVWGNNNWPPSMKVKKLETFQSNSTSKECKWPSLNVPGTKYPLSHPILKLGEFSFPIISLLG